MQKKSVIGILCFLSILVRSIQSEELIYSIDFGEPELERTEPFGQAFTKMA